MQDNIWDYLIATDYLHDLKNGPMLATEWHRTDDRTLEFTLRQGVKFHDGSEMTAEDVAFTFGDQRIMSPTSRGYAPSRPFLGTIEKAEATGRYSVRLATKQPDPLIERRLGRLGRTDHQQARIPRRQGLGRLGPRPGRHRAVQAQPSSKAANPSC